NRLQKYETFAGLQQSLEIMSVHKSAAINPILGIEFLAANEQQLRNHFDQFMTEALQKFPH
ncbi:MAG: ACP phosphodiesterase, partial [Bacillota bacterium]